jgi:paraquat-inducible protein B
MRWPFPLIWLVPLLAAIMAGFYAYDRLEDRGTAITVRFTDATGLKVGETQMVHRGVPIGLVTGVELTPDQKQALVHVRLRRPQTSFARKGSLFWIVRPEISTEAISGLSTVLSGPVIDSIPGSGETQTEFTGLDKPPAPAQEGLTIVLKTPHLEHLQPDSPIYYRGIQVGHVQDVQLGIDATSADIHAIILRRFIPLVRANSQFWALSAVDLKGGLFTGVQMKVESLRSLLSGGITFATPDKKMGDQAQNGATFVLHDDPEKEWLTWSPKISIEPDNPGHEEQNPKLPTPPQAIRAAGGSN